MAPTWLAVSSAEQAGVTMLSSKMNKEGHLLSPELINNLAMAKQQGFYLTIKPTNFNLIVGSHHQTKRQNEKSRTMLLTTVDDDDHNERVFDQTDMDNIVHDNTLSPSILSQSPGSRTDDFPHPFRVA